MFAIVSRFGPARRAVFMAFDLPASVATILALLPCPGQLVDGAEAFEPEADSPSMPGLAGEPSRIGRKTCVFDVLILLYCKRIHPYDS